MQIQTMQLQCWNSGHAYYYVYVQYNIKSTKLLLLWVSLSFLRTVTVYHSIVQAYTVG